MSDSLWTAVEDYITKLIVRPDDAVNVALHDSHYANLPAINVTPNLGKLLHILAKLTRAKHILEIGTLGGYSTIWLARALAPGGKLVTLEHESMHADVARRNIARAGLENVVELRLGRALDTLPQLAAEKCEPFDLVFIDADKPNNLPYFEWALKLTHPGSLIIVDNVVRKGDILDESSTDVNVQGTRRLFEFLSNDSRISTTVLQTVGSKGYDGILMAIVE